MSLLLAAALLVPAPAQALAGDSTPWERVIGDAESTLFVDPASIRREGDLARVRWRSDYAEASEGDGMKSLVVQAVVDCNARTFSFRRIEGYRADGALIQSFDLAADHAQAAPRTFPPEEEPTYRRICGPA